MSRELLMLLQGWSYIGLGGQMKQKNAKENSFLIFDSHLVVKGLGGAYGKTMFESS